MGILEDISGVWINNEPLLDIAMQDREQDPEEAPTLGFWDSPDLWGEDPEPSIAKRGMPTIDQPDFSTQESTRQTRDVLQEAGVPAVGVTQLERENRSGGFDVDAWQNKWSPRNGRIPIGRLRPVEGGTHHLAPGAAAAWKAMKRAAAKDGVTLSLTDSYRTYDAQVRLAAEKGLYSQGGLAAEPGTSDHGFGLAVDVGDGEQRTWIAEHGAGFGWVADTPRENWHFGYKGGYSGPVPTNKKNRRPRAPKPPGYAPPTQTRANLGNRDPFATFSVMASIEMPDRPPPEKKDQLSGKWLKLAPEDQRAYFKQAAKKFGLPVGILVLTAQTESGFNPEAVSPVGAEGEMQIMPSWDVKHPFDARTSIFRGAEILAGYIAQMGSIRKGLAAYNAGARGYLNGLGYADSILDQFRDN